MTAIRAAVHDGFVVLVAFFALGCMDNDLLEGLVRRLSHGRCGVEKSKEKRKMLRDLRGYGMILSVGEQLQKGKRTGYNFQFQVDTSKLLRRKELRTSVTRRVTRLTCWCYNKHASISYQATV